MKRSIKRALVSALVLALIGVACLMISAPFGGRRQAAEIVNSHGNSLLLNKILRSAIEDVSIEGVIDDIKVGSGEKEVIAKGKEVKDLRLEIGAISLKVEQTKDDEISIKADSNVKVTTDMDGKKLRIELKQKNNKINFASAQVVLYLPEGMEFDDADIDIGASEAVISTSIDCEDLTLNVGAGDIRIASIRAKDAKISVGAGKLDIENFNVKNADLNVGAGDIDIEGDVTDDLKIKCGMGNINMNLAGSEDDHDYNYTVAMGNLNMGSMQISGISSSKKIDNDKSSKYDIDLGMGNVNISFEE